MKKCLFRRNNKMKKIILYHGSPNRIVVPKYGFGEERHDYGKGFYLTESIELAKEWAVCRPNEANGLCKHYECHRIVGLFLQNRRL